MLNSRYASSTGLASSPAWTAESDQAFAYFGGAFDLSWLAWFYKEIAPDVRRRSNIPGPQTADEADRACLAKAAMAETLGLEVALCGTRRDGQAW